MPSYDSPSGLVQAALAAHVAGEWRVLVGLLNPASVDRWCRQFVTGNTRVVSLDEIRRELPEASPETVAAHVERTNVRARAFIARLSDHIPGVQSVEELATLPSAELLVRILDADDPISRINRGVAAAYSAAGIERPADTIRERSARTFEIVRVTRLSKNEVRVTFREAGAPDHVQGTWSVGRDPEGQWWLRMDREVLRLPGGHVNYIDDPVVLAYIERYSEQ